LTDAPTTSAAFRPDEKESPVSFRLGYRPELDGVRAIAVMMVVAVHMMIPGLGGGYVALDVFFVLSGFLITALLLEEWGERGRIAVGRFYLRRALRILPGSMLMLLLVSVYAVFTLAPEAALDIRKGALYASLYIMNWAWAAGWTGLSVVTHTWSLSLEEQFYIVWPLLLVGILSLPGARKWKMWTVGALFLLSIAARIWMTMDIETFFRSKVLLISRSDGLFAGCLIAMLFCWKVIPTGQRVLVAVSRVGSIAGLSYLAYIVVRPLHDSVYTPHGITSFTLAAALILIALLCSPSGRVHRFLGSSPLRWVGRRSYGIYLWHFPMVGLPLGPLGLPPAAPTVADAPELAVRLLLTLIVAGVSYRFVELPALRLRNRWKEGNAVSAEVPAQTVAVSS
jgi:peptidoglycan/LPS O-acetylase OafA/YrhL